MHSFLERNMAVQRRKITQTLKYNNYDLTLNDWMNNGNLKNDNGIAFKSFGERNNYFSKKVRDNCDCYSFS